MAQRINLLVKKDHGVLGNSIQYTFRVNSYEALSLSDYRVVAYFHTRWRQTDTATNTGSGQPHNGNSGNPAMSISFVSWNDTSSPPRIYPSDERYNIKVRIKFTTGSGVDGGYWDDINFTLRHSSYKEYQSNADVNSYTYQSSTSYGSNATFVLEYNGTDPNNPDSANWVKVEEVTDNIGTVDPNTGQYPMGDTIKDDTTQEDPVTGVKHMFLFPDADAYITSGTLPGGDAKEDRNYGVSDPLRAASNWWDGTQNSDERILLHYDVAGSVLTGSDTVNASEAWAYVESRQSQSGDVFDLVNITSSWTEGTKNGTAGDPGEVDWASAAASYGSIIFQNTNPSNISSVTDVYMIGDLGTSVVEGWADGTNYGVGIKFNDEGGSGKYDTMASRHTTTLDEPGGPTVAPRLIVAYTEGAGPVTPRRIFLVT